MGFDFTFRLADSIKDLSGLTDFLIKQDMGYPFYEDWVLRAMSEIEMGYKKAIMAFSEKKLVGDLIYQRHKDFPRMRELKNIRIHPSLRKRYFANFMLKQAEVDKPDDYDVIICDVRSDQPAMINLLKISGYTSLTTTCLYDKNVKDIIMIKDPDRLFKLPDINKL